MFKNEGDEMVKSNKKEISTTKKVVKITAIVLASIICLMILIVGGYVIYVSVQFYRIEDNLALSISNKKEEKIEIGKEYSILTYNIGFGAYDHDYSFFMDTGTMKSGEKVKGKYGKAASKERAFANTNGSIETVKNQNTDFVFMQEVDTDSTRSYGVNQYEKAQELSTYSSIFASNFHSAYLLYPFNDPIGASNSGIVTLSKYNVASSVRRSFPVDMGFFAKFFDLDRCFSISYLDAPNGKQLALINIHMSAYDEGGLIRVEQLKLLNEVLKAEAGKGNYVVAGGDFNHDIAGSIDKFESEQLIPDWVFKLTNDDLSEGFRFAADNKTPSCRGADIPYEKGVNYTVTIDGFIVSDNIDFTVETLDADFEFSDHNPVKMLFTLKN